MESNTLTAIVVQNYLLNVAVVCSIGLGSEL